MRLNFSEFVEINRVGRHADIMPIHPIFDRSMIDAECFITIAFLPVLNCAGGDIDVIKADIFGSPKWHILGGMSILFSLKRCRNRRVKDCIFNSTYRRPDRKSTERSGFGHVIPDLLCLSQSPVDNMLRGLNLQ